ncbi:PhzF family phenazine biosynthesis protein [Tistrella bauzanensis]|uniref:PhzF family phenazine biosynthesis protein n=1 Tax=Tistrella arctica TaxID=3133430 RepID=A0ABU9YSL9_9PROT
MDIMKISAFTPDAAQGAAGGNPAGVVFVDSMPDEARMLSVASGLGYSETAFLLPLDDGWRVRYFAPRQEVPFCGHATIALGAALGRRFGAGIYPLALNHARITVEAMAAGDTGWAAALQSPPTRTRLLPDGYIRAVLDEFGLTAADLDHRLPVRLIHGGANHMVVALASRRRLSQLGYHFARGAALQAEQSLVTFSFIHAETDTRFHARNFFAIGGAYEDPATGAAAAALAGYLREIHWLEAGTIEITQGEDMGRPSLIRASFDAEPGGSVRVAGLTAPIV